MSDREGTTICSNALCFNRAKIDPDNPQKPVFCEACQKRVADAKAGKR